MPATNTVSSLAAGGHRAADLTRVAAAANYLIRSPDYRQLVEDFAQAGRRAKEAGYDYVSYHFCHGSLPHVTLSLIDAPFPYFRIGDAEFGVIGGVYTIGF